MEIKFGEVYYYLTQPLYGHGYFWKYLFKMGKMTRPNYVYGDASIDDAKHTFFHCERWRLERRNLEGKVGICIVEKICEVILSSNEISNSEASYTEALLKSKELNLDNITLVPEWAK